MAGGIGAKLTVEDLSARIFVRLHWTLLPAAAQAPPQVRTWKPASGTAVQLLLPPAVTLAGVQLTAPLPLLTVALMLYVAGGMATKLTVEV